MDKKHIVLKEMLFLCFLLMGIILMFESPFGNCAIANMLLAVGTIVLAVYIKMIGELRPTAQVAEYTQAASDTWRLKK